jgi:DNA-directed RNA polymerase specialized sigma subunit
MKYTHDDNFINLDDELDESDRFEGPVEKDKKEVRKKVWRRTGSGQWEGERGLDLRENEEFVGAGLYLSKRRPGKRLNSFDEADLIRAYRAGDKSAGNGLIESLLWLVRGIAGNQKERGKLKYGRAFYGPSYDDKVAAGVSGLRDAIEKYDLRHNTRLSTYAVHWIMKAIGAECELWRYRGMGGQTRADRVLFSDTKLTAEELAAKTECSLKSAEDAIRRLEMKELPYNSREGGNDDDEDGDTGAEKKKPLVLAETYCPIEVHPQGHFVTDDDWEGIKAASSRPGFSARILSMLPATAPLNKTAAKVTSQHGEHYNPDINYSGHWHADAPPKMRKIPARSKAEAAKMIGLRTGRLKVVGLFAAAQKGKPAKWVVRCVCGDYARRLTAYKSARSRD